MDKKIILLGGGHGSILPFENLINKFNVEALVLEKYDKKSDEHIIDYCKKHSVKIIDFNDIYDNYSDLIIMIGFKRRIDINLLNKFKIINVHYSLLPKYRGLHSIAWAIINGEKKVGYTIHEVDEGIDSGNIIYQYEKEIKEDDNSWAIMNEFDKHIGKNITRIIQKYLDGEIETIKQDNSEASYVAKRNIYDCYIQWDKNCQYILNLIRAVVPPYPGAFTVYKNKKIIILSAEKYDMENYEEIFGHIVNIEKGKGIIVKAGDGFIRIKKILMDGTIINADDYFNVSGVRLGINLLEIYLQNINFS